MKKLKSLTGILFLYLFFAAITAQAQMNLALTPSNYNGYNVSCFGGSNGSVDLTVTGGTSPYTYEWSNGSTTEDISGQMANYYRVVVTDATSATADAEITLTEPSALTLTLEPYQCGLTGIM